MTLWKPTDLTSVTLEGWYRVHDVTGSTGDGADLTGTSPVTAWADKSGHGRNLANAGSPVYSATGLDATHPAVTLSFCGFWTAAGQSYPAGAVLGAMVVGGLSSSGRVVSFTAGAGNDYDNTGMIPIYDPSASVQFYYNGASCDISSAAIAIPALLAGIPLSTTTAKSALNAVLSTNAAVAIAGVSATRMGLFADAMAGANNPSGACAEAVIFAGVLSTGDRASLEGYIAWNNGQQALLPTGHTYKSAAPTITTAGFFAREYYDLSTRTVRNV
jgi:hypothetical protein